MRISRFLATLTALGTLVVLLDDVAAFGYGWTIARN